MALFWNFCNFYKLELMNSRKSKFFIVFLELFLLERNDQKMDLDFFQNGTQLPENINYIQDHAHIFVPYFLTNCLGMFFGTIGKLFY